MMQIIGDKIIFSDGKEVRANCGMVGLSPDMEVGEGADGSIHSPREDWMSDEDHYGLTKAEQIELADFMIAAWTKFKDVAA